MGRGKRIQDFRSLNLDSSKKQEEEFIIEVEEKPREKKKKQNSFSVDDVWQEQEKIEKKKTKKEEKEKKEVYSKQEKSSKTYLEKENEKRKKEKRKQTSFVVSSFLLVFITIGVIAGCLVTPTFDVKSVIVEDGEHVKASEIQQYFSAVKGKNTFLIDTSTIGKEIETHPYIYQATITRKLPDQLEVTYKERKPYAFLKYIESYILMDKYGSILEVKQENDMPELPIIYGLELEEFSPGEKLEGVVKLKFENAVYLLETAEHVDFEYTISELNYTDTEEMRISIQEMNIEIIYGTVEREILNDKITYLNEILKELEGKKGTLDISSSNYSEKVIFKEILK